MGESRRGRAKRSRHHTHARQTSEPIVHEPDDEPHAHAHSHYQSQHQHPPSHRHAASASFHSHSSSSSSRRPGRRHTESALSPFSLDPFGGLGMGMGGVAGAFEMMDRMERMMDGMFETNFGTGMGMGMGGGRRAARPSALASMLPDVGSMESPLAGSNSSSYCFSSSTLMTSGPDGRPLVRQSRSESKRVGSLSESTSAYADSLGNRRVSMARGSGDRSRQLVHERNQRGEERQLENLRHLRPEEVQRFDEEWEAERRRVDPAGRMLGRRISATPTHQPARLHHQQHSRATSTPVTSHRLALTE